MFYINAYISFLKCGEEYHNFFIEFFWMDRKGRYSYAFKLIFFIHYMQYN